MEKEGVPNSEPAEEDDFGEGKPDTGDQQQEEAPEEVTHK